MAINDGANLGRLVHAAYDKREFALAEGSIAETFTWRVVPFGTGSAGVAGYREVMEAWSSAFPDSTATPVKIIEGGDQAAIEFMFSGTHDGVLSTPTGDVAPTGKKVDISVCNVYRCADGKLIEAHSYFDAATMMRQLGLMP
jgi:predicted ester cyclase